MFYVIVFFFKQKTAYEMRISDWSSDVCSSDLDVLLGVLRLEEQHLRNNHVGHVVVDAADQEDHPLLQQARVDVVRALAAAGLFDHHRHEVQGLCLLVHLERHLWLVWVAGRPVPLIWGRRGLGASGAPAGPPYGRAGMQVPGGSPR